MATSEPDPREPQRPSLPRCPRAAPEEILDVDAELAQQSALLLGVDLVGQLGLGPHGPVVGAAILEELDDLALVDVRVVSWVLFDVVSGVSRSHSHVRRSPMKAPEATTLAMPATISNTIPAFEWNGVSVSHTS